MQIKVRSIGLIKQLLGKTELPADVPEGTTVAGLLRFLAEEKTEKMAPFTVGADDSSGHAPLRVLVNGRDIQVLQGTHTILQEGDDVLMFVPIAGG